MRDILLTAIIACLLVAVFRQPAIGPLLWAWISLMNPHRLTYGFAQTLGFAMIIALVTLLALLFTKRRYAFPMTSLSVTWLFFLFWMSVTSLFAINEWGPVSERWIFIMKIQLMLLVTVVLIRTRQHLEWLIWVVTLSIVFYGIKGGLWTVITGGGNRVWGPVDSMVQDNNALAVALIVLVPFLYYLFQVSARPWVRRFLVFAIVTTCLGILGSQSRGALLGVIAMAAVLGLKSRYPVRISLALVVVLAIGFAFMPDSWTERMSTIREYKADESAMSRMYTWTTLWNLAADRPLVGGGFRADYLPVFLKYAPTGPEFSAFQGMFWVAHSIYFQVLGEHGFVGLALFIGIGVLTWRRAGQLAETARSLPEFADWVPKLMPMVQTSLVGFAVGGAFLSLAYFDLPYYLMAYVLIVDGSVRASQARVASAAAVVGRPTPAKVSAHALAAGAHPNGPGAAEHRGP